MIARRDYRLGSGSRSRSRSRARSSSAPSRSGSSAWSSSLSWPPRSRSRSTGAASALRSRRPCSRWCCCRSRGTSTTQSAGGNAIFGRGMTLISLDSHWPARFYVDPGLPAVITHPQRAELGVALVPILYADTWGDYFGIWSWGSPRPELTPAVDRRLALQSVVGLPLTAFALAGWFAFTGLDASRWREAPERLVVALAPLVGLAAVALLRGAQLPARRRHREGALSASCRPALGGLVRFRRRRARRAKPPRRCIPCSAARPLPARLPRLRRPSPSSRERVGLPPRRLARGRRARCRGARRLGDPDRPLRGPRLQRCSKCLVEREGRDARRHPRPDRAQRRARARSAR